MTKQQRIYESLREEILSGKLAPGERLLLNKVADRFEVSPIPVREALRQLEREELIDVLPHVSVIVRELPFSEAVWAQEIRLALEPVAAREAVPQAGDHHVELMRAAIDAWAKGQHKGNGAGSMDNYNAFHDVLFSITPNRRLVNIIERQRATARRLAAITGESLVSASSFTDLNQVLSALEARDADEVYSRVRAHREEALALLMEWTANQESAGVTA